MQMKKIVLVGIMTVIMLSGCGKTVQNSVMREETTQETRNTEQESVTEKDISMNEKESFNAESNINDVINDSAFESYGRLIFPVDMEIEDNLKLKDVSSILPWYSEVNTEKTVEIVNYMKSQAMNGYGLYAFYRRQIGDYLLMRMHFVFYDYEEGVFPFLIDYLAVMILIAYIGYYIGLLLKKICKRKLKGSY